MEDVTLAMDNKHNMDVIYLDFKKAFDSVPHKRLVAKIKSYGLGEPLVSWIEAFLSDRRQFVMIGNQASHTRKVLSGVPKGSILGPLLLLIYINDIDDLIQNSIVLKYAHDV